MLPQRNLPCMRNDIMIGSSPVKLSKDFSLYRQSLATAFVRRLPETDRASVIQRVHKDNVGTIVLESDQQKVLIPGGKVEDFFCLLYENPDLNSADAGTINQTGVNGGKSEDQKNPRSLDLFFFDRFTARSPCTGFI